MWNTLLYGLSINVLEWASISFIFFLVTKDPKPNNCFDDILIKVKIVSIFACYVILLPVIYHV